METAILHILVLSVNFAKHLTLTDVLLSISKTYYTVNKNNEKSKSPQMTTI